MKHLRVLLRSPATLAVIFLPGIVLYSIFTAIFAGPAARPFRVAVIDQDESSESRRLIAELAAQKVRVVRTENEAPDGIPLTEESAQELIRRRGKFRVAVVIPKGFGEAPNALVGERHRGVTVYYDALEPVEAEIFIGMLQMAAGREFFLKMFGAVVGRVDEDEAAVAATKDAEPRMLIKVDKHDVVGQRMKIASKHTFLAGIVPMFLLFSAVNAARTILEALGTGEMRRLLAAPLRPGHILLGEMLFSFLLAMMQCCVMYFFAWLVFDVDIWAIAGGLLLLTLVTCLATTGFGVMIGSFCRTTEQLDSLGTMIILAMSAIGGSMVPRWIMPEWMQQLGLMTINGWAYDGFMALIQGFGLRGILEECGVLLGVSVLCAALGCMIFNRRLRLNPAG